MRIDWDLPITLPDGTVLRADVYRPNKKGTFPVIMTMGPYGKGLAWQDELYATTWNLVSADHPDAIKDSTDKYQSWETVDPEFWEKWEFLRAVFLSLLFAIPRVVIRTSALPDSHPPLDRLSGSLLEITSLGDRSALLLLLLIRCAAQSSTTLDPAACVGVQSHLSIVPRP